MVKLVDCPRCKRKMHEPRVLCETCSALVILGFLGLTFVAILLARFL